MRTARFLGSNMATSADIAQLLSTGADDDNIARLLQDYINESEEEDEQEDDDFDDDNDDWGLSDAEVAIHNMQIGTTSTTTMSHSHQPLIITNGEESISAEVEKAKKIR